MDRRKPEDKDAGRYNTAPHGGTDTAIVMDRFLTPLVWFLDNPNKLRYFLILFMTSVFLFCGIIYPCPWVQAPLETPGAKIGLNWREHVASYSGGVSFPRK
jgi:hypothetical protein